MTAVSVRAADIGAWLRERRRANRPPTRTGDVLYRLYLAVLFGIPLVWYVNRAIALDALQLAPSARAAVLDLAPAALPALLLVCLLAGLRFGAWQGPVVLSRPDTRWVLAAPVERRALLAGPLARGMAVGAGLGSVAGLVVAAAGAVLLGAGFARLLPLAVICLTAYAALIAGLSWFVECSPALARAILRWTPAVLAVSAVIAVAGVLLDPWAGWWGPPGWVAVVLLEGIGVTTVAWQPALLVLVLSAAAAIVAALRRADAAPFDQLELRGTFGAGFRASIYFLDLRAAGLARRAASRAVAGRRARRLPPPRRAALAPAWSHLLQVMRAQRLGRFWTGIGLAVVALAPAWAPGLPVAFGVFCAALAGYVAASAVIEPVWTEREQRFGQHHLHGDMWRLVAVHIAVAGVLLGVALTFGLAIVVLLRPGVDPLIIALGPLLGPLLALAAAMPPTGPPPDISLLLFNESGIALVMGALLRGPLAALLLTAQPLATTLLAPSLSSLTSALLWASVTGTLFVVWLRNRVSSIS